MKPIDFPEDDEVEVEELSGPAGDFWTSPTGNLVTGAGIGFIAVIGASFFFGIELFLITFSVGAVFVVVGLVRLFWAGYTDKDRKRK